MPIFRAFSATHGRASHFRKNASRQNGRYRNWAGTMPFGGKWVYNSDVEHFMVIAAWMLIGIIGAIFVILLFGEDY